PPPVSALLPYTTLFRSSDPVGPPQAIASGGGHPPAHLGRWTPDPNTVPCGRSRRRPLLRAPDPDPGGLRHATPEPDRASGPRDRDRKSTRLNSSHVKIS